jgi:mono/diheme cytochrome c family protein
MLASDGAGKIHLGPAGVSRGNAAAGERPANGPLATGSEAAARELVRDPSLVAGESAGRISPVLERKPQALGPEAIHNKQEEHMRKTWLYTAALVLGAASFAFAAPPQGNAKEGKTLYDQHCKMCHGPHGEGNQAMAKMMKVKMLPLGSKEVQAKSDAQLKKDITEGVGKMSPVKGLSGKQVDDIIAFVRTLGKGHK